MDQAGDNRKDLEVAIAAAKQAGQLAMSYFGKQYEIREKSPNNPVSEADIAVDNLIQNDLRNRYPHYGWLSEESEDDGSRFSNRRSWFVDPIDGTRAFIKGLPNFSVSIALIEDNLPILGVIFNPATEEIFFANKGHGAFKNDNKIEVSKQSEIAGTELLGDPYQFQSNKWPSEWQQMNVTRKNSIAYRMALVAAGEFDGAIASMPKNDWDIAAGTIIVQEAGGISSDTAGFSFNFNQRIPSQNSMICAGAILHRQFVKGLATIKY